MTQQLQQTVILKVRGFEARRPTQRSGATSGLLAIVALLLVVAADHAAWAGVDTSGSVVFDFLAEEDRVFLSLDEIPADAPFVQGTTSGFFSSGASSFGDDGVFVWSGFELTSIDGPRYGILMLDIDLAQAPLDGQTPVPHQNLKVEYLEKRGDTILFQASPSKGDVWIVDVFFHESDRGAVEGDFALIFSDPNGGFPGCRVITRGHFVTDPTPARLRRQYGITSDGPTSEVYVDSGCSGGVVIEDHEGCDCGGSSDSSDSSGCEGDSTSSDSGCEGDSGGGCEGDSGGSSSCSGDTGGGGCGDSCDQKAHATVSTPVRRYAPLREVLRFFPEISVFLFITWMRQRNRKR